MHELECVGCFFAMRAKRKTNFFTTLVCNLCLVPRSDGQFAFGLITKVHVYVTGCTYKNTRTHTHTTLKQHVDSREAVNFLALWQSQRKELKHRLFNHPLARACPKLVDSKSDDQLVFADVTSAKGKPSAYTLMREFMHVPCMCHMPYALCVQVAPAQVLTADHAQAMLSAKGFQLISIGPSGCKHRSLLEKRHFRPHQKCLYQASQMLQEKALRKKLHAHA